LENPHYKKSGTKSYVHLMRKWGFQPTLEGPYFISEAAARRKSLFGFKRSAKTEQPEVVMKRKKKAPSTGTGAGSGSTAGAGEVTAEDVQNDSLYLAEVQIGTPAQTFKLDFDTGSADLWVWSTHLPKTTISQNPNHTVFDSTKSSTFKATSSTWQIGYGDGSTASGTVGTDNVSIGGLLIKAQAVELASKLSAQFVQDSGDGLLGLAFGSINTVQPHPVATPVENMITQADIPKEQELFTAKLGSWRDADEPDKGESFYTFGFIDQATVTASGQEIYYTPVDNSQGFWTFDSASASVNGKSIARSGNTAIADTGTTLALVDDTVCKAIYAAIPGATYDSDVQGYIFPTGLTADQFPVVTFAVGEKQFAVQKEDLGFAEAKTGFVYGGIQSRGDMTFDILGDTFLKGIYAIFDQGNTRFGAVQRAETTQNVSDPPS